MAMKFRVIFFAFLFLNACENVLGIETPSMLSKEVDAKETAAHITIIVPTYTPSPFLTIRPPTATPMPTITPLIPTPIATLPPEQALLEVSSLLSTYPDGCHLPCFWHVTPGQTFWSEASNILHYFSTRESVNRDDFFLAQYYYTIPNEDWPQEVRLYIRHDMVEAIKTKNINSTLYSLSNIFDVYGAPDQIWITTFRSASYTTNNTVPFMVFLLYSQSQFLVSYELINGVVANDQVSGCISGDPSLYIWSSQNLIEFQDILKYFGFYFPDQVYLRLLDATEGIFNEEDFFKNPNEEVCINTPADFWPDL